MKTKSFIAFVIFLAILTIPFWASAASGAMGKGAPRPLGNATGNQYIDIEAMRNHMHTIKDTGADACLKCHTDRADFCDRCHDYAGVEPDIDSLTGK